MSVEQDSREIKPLKIKKERMSRVSNMERELKLEARTFQNPALRVEDEIDENPYILDDTVSIMIYPEQWLLEFDMVRSGYMSAFCLKQVIAMKEKFEIKKIKAKKILIPLCMAAEQNKLSAILHYVLDDQFHLRILNTQLEKFYTIGDGKLNVFGQRDNLLEWTIQITDHRHWSTN
jgi:hypothetical protein